MTERNEGDIGFIPRSTVIDLMRANWQDPAGFHEAMAAHLDIDEEAYTPEHAWDNSLRGRFASLQEKFVGIAPADDLEQDLLVEAVRLAQNIGLSGDRELIVETTPWFEANGLPTPEFRASEARR